MIDEHDIDIRDEAPIAGRGSNPAHDALTRRLFLRRAGTIGGFVAVGGAQALLAACTSESPTPTPTAGTRSPESDFDLTGVIYGELYPTLPRGGELDIVITQTADTLDVLASAAGAAHWQADPAHDFLERYDHTGELVPSLAESLEIVDPTTLRYVLREARFHNGRDVTADDVREVIEWMQDPANGSEKQSSVENVDVEVEDERTVVLRLSAPDPGFRHTLPRIPIVPIEEMASQAEAPIGCGPFLFQEWVRDSHIDYAANADYWNPEAPRVDTLRITTLQDVQAAATSFLAGQHSYVQGVPAAFAADFEARADQGEFDIGVLYPGVVWVGFQTEVEPFTDPRVRRALGLAIDRPAVAEAFAGALGSVPMWTAPLAPDHPWYAEDLETARDLDAARALLADAGFPDGFSGATLRVEEWSQSPNAGAVVQSNWAEIGVNVDLEVTDSPTFLQRGSDGEFEIYLSGWAITPEPSPTYAQWIASNGSTNFFRYENDRVDTLIEQARETTDETERGDLYHQVMQLAFIEDPAVLPLCTEAEMYAYREGVNGDQFRPVPGPLWHFPIASIAS